MKYAGIINNDVVNGQGICVSVWCQGCPHRCPGCHNPETWDFNGGTEISIDTLRLKALQALNKNGIQRNLSILGGEPLCENNLDMVLDLITLARHASDDEIQIFVWTGYTFETLLQMAETDYRLLGIMLNTDYLIDGPFILSQRDITLPLRGSANQRVIKCKESFDRKQIIIAEEYI